jgi:hypothetical protein
MKRTPGAATQSEDERWFALCQEKVVAHLKLERRKHGALADWPAWHVAPIVSLWAVRDTEASVPIVSWVICGDVPTDLISAHTSNTPRAAVRAFAQRWHDAALQMANAQPKEKIAEKKVERAHELALFLEVRARQLTDWTNDDSMWDVDDL